jgi:hypothetical protein
MINKDYPNEIKKNHLIKSASLKFKKVLENNDN